MAIEEETLQHQSPSDADPQSRPDTVKWLEGMEVGTVQSQVFDPEALQLLCRRDLPAALRQLADHLERQDISGSLWSFQGNGMVQDWRREHFLMTLDLAVLTPAEKP